LAQLTAFNLKGWIDAHRDRLKPPVGNALVFEDTDFQVMIVGGPNKRNDYHLDPGEELFYQLEGDIVLKVVENGVPRDIPIREGEMLLLPPGVPHSPQRGAGTVGMVLERRRTPDEEDRFRWYCERCHAVVHEASLFVSDLGTQLKPVLEAYRDDARLRTCRACGAVNPPAGG
jgi:3-hydroxyanthranilate 3,4-dioxygenase